MSAKTSAISKRHQRRNFMEMTLSSQGKKSFKYASWRDPKLPIYPSPCIRHVVMSQLTYGGIWGLDTSYLDWLTEHSSLESMLKETQDSQGEKDNLISKYIYSQISTCGHAEARVSNWGGVSVSPPWAPELSSVHRMSFHVSKEEASS